MRAIDGFAGGFVTLSALKLSALTFVRPGELRHAEWTEVNLDAATWQIPGEKMKMGLPHIVPLSTHAVDILRELHRLTGRGRYVFPSERGQSRPMSGNTVNAALRRLGFTKDEMSAHNAPSRATEDDAGVGGLPGQAAHRRGRVADARPRGVIEKQA
jgi:integrase